MSLVSDRSLKAWGLRGATLGIPLTVAGIFLLPRLGIYSLTVWECGGVAAASAVAGLVRGLSGFGSAMVLFPLLSVAVGPVVAAPVTQALDSSLTLPLLRRAFKNYVRREVLPAVVSAVLFVPLGVRLLFLIDGVTLRRVASIVIIGVVVLMSRGWKYRRRPNIWTSLGVGAVSGVMGGSTTLSGPPVVLFWLGGQADSETVRANVIVFFALSEFWTLVLYMVNGLYTVSALVLIVALAAPFGIGVWVGARAKKYVSEERFLIFALGIIGVSAFVSLIG